MTFTIVVEGIEDTSLVANIEETIRIAFVEIGLPGSWRVIVRPSPVNGRWDFRIHGLNVRHTLSIAGPANHLSSVIPGRLRKALLRASLSQVERMAVCTRACARALTRGETVNARPKTGTEMPIL